MLIAALYREGVRLPVAAAWALGIAACRRICGGRDADRRMARAVLGPARRRTGRVLRAVARRTWRPGPAGRFFGLLGDASYSLYLVHPLTFPLVRWTVGRLFVGTDAGWLYAAIAWLAAIAASVACYLVVRAPDHARAAAAAARLAKGALTITARAACSPHGAKRNAG